MLGIWCPFPLLCLHISQTIRLRVFEKHVVCGNFHSKVWLPLKCAYQTGRQTDGQTDRRMERDTSQNDPYKLLCKVQIQKLMHVIQKFLHHIIHVHITCIVIYAVKYFICFFFHTCIKIPLFCSSNMWVVWWVFTLHSLQSFPLRNNFWSFL